MNDGSYDLDEEGRIMMNNTKIEGLYHNIEEIEDNNLQYVLSISLESEQMSGWEDSLYLILNRNFIHR